MRFQVDIPGVGQIDVDGNFATDDSIQELLGLMRSQNTSSKSPMKDFNKDIDNASKGLDSFSTTLDDVEDAQKNLATRMTGLANGLENGVNSMKQFVDSGGNMTSVMNSIAPVIEGTARGIGGLIPVIGEGLEELTGAAATAAFGLATAAVGMIEGFIGLNKQLYNFNLMGAGGFEAFADAADVAQIPINEFASAMINSSEKLRLFGSGAPGGIGQISQALSVLQRGQLLEQLYSLGFTTEEVVAGMADYAIGAERQGKALNAAELASGSFAYLKNLRELARLTGVSVKDQQSQMDADRANLFIQNQMLNLAPETRKHAMAFASAIPEALIPIKDFVVSGQSYNTESALMVSQMPTVATALRNAYTSIENGSKTADEAQAELTNTLQSNRELIDAELKLVTATFGTAPDSIIQEGDALGKALVAVTGLMNAAEVEVPSKIAGGENSKINTALGKMEETINKVQSEVQQSLLTMTSGLTPVLNRFADSVDTIVTAIGDGRTALEKYFGEFENKEFSIDTMFTDLFTRLENSIRNAITVGFNDVMASTKLGSMMGFKSSVDHINELKELYGLLDDDEKLKEFFEGKVETDAQLKEAVKLVNQRIDSIEELGFKLPKSSQKVSQETSAVVDPTDAFSGGDTHGEFNTIDHARIAALEAEVKKHLDQKQTQAWVESIDNKINQLGGGVPPDYYELPGILSKSISERMAESLELERKAKAEAADQFLAKDNDPFQTNSFSSPGSFGNLGGDFDALTIPIGPPEDSKMGTFTLTPISVDALPEEVSSVQETADELKAYMQGLSETFPQALDPNYRIGTVGFGWNDLTENDRIRRQEGIDRRANEIRDLDKHIDEKLKEKFGSLGETNKHLNEIVQQNRTMLSYLENTSIKSNEMSSSMAMANYISRQNGMSAA